LPEIKVISLIDMVHLRRHAPIMCSIPIIAQLIFFILPLRGQNIREVRVQVEHLLPDWRVQEL
jgi:hypothetical protein